MKYTKTTNSIRKKILKIFQKKIERKTENMIEGTKKNHQEKKL